MALGAALDACVFLLTYLALVGAQRIDWHDYVAFFCLWTMCVGVAVSAALAMMAPRSFWTGLGMVLGLPLPVVLFIGFQFFSG